LGRDADASCAAELRVLDGHSGRDRSVWRARRGADDVAHGRRLIALARQHHRLALQESGAVLADAAVDEQRALDVVQLGELRREHLRVSAVDAVVLERPDPHRPRGVPVVRVEAHLLSGGERRVRGRLATAVETHLELLRERHDASGLRGARRLSLDRDTYGLVGRRLIGQRYLVAVLYWELFVVRMSLCMPVVAII